MAQSPPPETLISRDELWTADVPEEADGITNWISQCPECGESQENHFTPVFSNGFGNVSLKLKCRACFFSHTDRDWRAVENLKRHLRLKRFFRKTYYGSYPEASSTVHDATTCPCCGGEDVLVELQRKRVREDYNTAVYVGTLRFVCRECESRYTSVLG